MDIPRFLDLASELESEISKTYGIVADHSGDPPTAAKLKEIAAEEVQHANSLRHGKALYNEHPDLFAGSTFEANEVTAGIEELRAFQASLASRHFPLAENLGKLLELEKRFERIHMGVSVKIVESSLKKLFTALREGDQSHILVLRTLIESIG